MATHEKIETREDRSDDHYYKDPHDSDTNSEEHLLSNPTEKHQQPSEIPLLNKAFFGMFPESYRKEYDISHPYKRGIKTAAIAATHLTAQGLAIAVLYTIGRKALLGGEIIAKLFGLTGVAAERFALTVAISTTAGNMGVYGNGNYELAAKIVDNIRAARSRPTATLSYKDPDEPSVFSVKYWTSTEGLWNAKTAANIFSGALLSTFAVFSVVPNIGIAFSSNSAPSTIEAILAANNAAANCNANYGGLVYQRDWLKSKFTRDPSKIEIATDADKVKANLELYLRLLLARAVYLPRSSYKETAANILNIIERAPSASTITNPAALKSILEMLTVIPDYIKNQEHIRRVVSAKPYKRRVAAINTARAVMLLSSAGGIGMGYFTLQNEAFQWLGGATYLVLAIVALCVIALAAKFTRIQLRQLFLPSSLPYMASEAFPRLFNALLIPYLLLVSLSFGLVAISVSNFIIGVACPTIDTCPDNPLEAACHTMPAKETCAEVPGFTIAYYTLVSIACALSPPNNMLSSRNALKNYFTNAARSGFLPQTDGGTMIDYAARIEELREWIKKVPAEHLLAMILLAFKQYSEEERPKIIDLLGKLGLGFNAEAQEIFADTAFTQHVNSSLGTVSKESSTTNSNGETLSSTTTTGSTSPVLHRFNSKDNSSTTSSINDFLDVEQGQASPETSRRASIGSNLSN